MTKQWLFIGTQTRNKNGVYDLAGVGIYTTYFYTTNGTINIVDTHPLYVSGN